MRTQVVLQKWGNSIALRLTGNLKTVPGFSVGDIVNVEISEKGLFVEKPARRRLSEAELLAGITPVIAHADEIATPFNEEVDY
ncbi:TPA: AbrB/MazE/SpoVT family DNA-binding domain-containing protein [Escherichia coli]|uniref:AbrB/MazE/SpoVT family DNA-binding domain-containing protein n=1 Tax=Escherichia coli TaxID=562 RepID=UPI001794EA8B|nr:transcriptional regulator [Escherichia coli]EFE8012317.1 transcriptional regulator [Escherichia coli]HBE5883633.1 transcriptional regulator [Escherichia coli]HDN1465415.1 transcriptional regulator [Escherichia coli]